MIQLYNSLTRQKERFQAITPQKVTLYVCGITPYDTTHLGHAFTYISFDILVRFLKHSGYIVAYTQNVTDMNDRDNDLLQRAKDLDIPWQELATYWTNKFLEDMKSLNWIMPTHYIKASENIPAMITLIQQLLTRRLAYQVSGNVYLDITLNPEFGKLSGLTKEQMLPIAREFEEDTENPQKKHPLDITLWKETSKSQLADSHIPSFPSPFSSGRPGWHIECSAMALKTLGRQVEPLRNGEQYQTIDIHGGGIDLLYPHHESEIAQSEGATQQKPFAKYWIHTGIVSYRGEKMSKSLGNLVLVSDLLKKYSSNALRFLLLSHHYRTPWEFKEGDLDEAQEKIAGIEKRVSTKEKGIPDDFLNALSDDLNTPLALEILQKEPVISPELFSLLGFTKKLKE